MTSKPSSKHIVIIGNGISGITAARHIRKRSNHSITVISAETDHFYSRTALMYIYMGHMKYENTKPYEDWFWEKNNIQLKRTFVKQVDTANSQLHFSDGETMAYNDLILAVGSAPNKFGWPGQDLNGVQGLFSYQDLQLMEANTKDIRQAVIIGGGLIGIEMAEMLISRGIKTSFLVREFKFWRKVLPPEESEMVGNHILEHHIDLRLGTELEEILSDENGRVRAIKTKDGEEIPCQFVGLTVGVHANIDFLKDSALELGRGIKVNEYLETNVPNVYAIGDCAQFEKVIEGRTPQEQIWYTGRMHGETVAATICGDRTAYVPGNFFNSAKLFDIEYQIYSKYMILPEGLEEVLWIDAKEKQAIRLFYDSQDGSIICFNLLGVRYRHNVCDKWITEKRNIEYVLTHLSEANFDPEFYKKNEQALLDVYEKKTGKRLKLQKRNWASILNLS